MSAASRIGGVIAIALVPILIGAGAGATLAGSLAKGYEPAMYVIGGLCAAAALVTWLAVSDDRPRTCRRRIAAAHYRRGRPNRHDHCRRHRRRATSSADSSLLGERQSVWRADHQSRSRPRNDLLPFDERFEVVESFFKTLAIHALDDERVSDLAEHAARQRVVERRGQARSIAIRGELPASAPRQHALHLEKLQLARLVVENRLGDRHGHAGRLHLKDDLAPFFGEGSGDVDLRHARIPVRPATGIAQERHGLLRRGLDLDVALHDRHRGSTRSLLPHAVPSRLEVYVPAAVAARRENEQRRLDTPASPGRTDHFCQFPELRIPR